MPEKLKDPHPALPESHNLARNPLVSSSNHPHPHPAGYNPLMTQPLKTLRDGAAQLGIPLTPHQLSKFQLYYQELTAWNRRANLTAITQELDVESKHFLDSLTICLAVPPAALSHSSIIDIGAGAGFPGLPIKLAFPEVKLTLADSVAKKTHFLEHLVATLSLTGVQVLTARAEELARQPELRESFDIALARGVAKLPTLLEYTLPFCKTGGQVVAWKHGGIDEELAVARAAAPLLGGQISAVHPVNLPTLTDNRILVVAAKLEPTPPQYPRRPGIPAKRPLKAASPPL